MEHFRRIRATKRDGMSIREIARKFGHSRKVVRKALTEPEPTPYTLRQPRGAPKLGPVQETIEQILAEDE